MQIALDGAVDLLAAREGAPKGGRGAQAAPAPGAATRGHHAPARRAQTSGMMSACLAAWN